MIGDRCNLLFGGEPIQHDDDSSTFFSKQPDATLLCMPIMPIKQSDQYALDKNKSVILTLQKKKRNHPGFYSILRHR
jgi:hypothetical protein